MRKTIVLIHLFLAAFTAPALLLVAISGGLYLLGVKGSIIVTELGLPAGAELDLDSPTIDADIKAFLRRIDVHHDYQYLKHRGEVLQTRPTSRTYLEFSRQNDVMSLTRNRPSLQKSMIELHKGHGPVVFQTYQKLVAISLLFIVASGIWLGLSNPATRFKTIAAAAAGSILFVALALY